LKARIVYAIMIICQSECKEEVMNRIRTAVIEDWTLGLLGTISASEWESAGYAKAELLFIIIAETILSVEIPDLTLVTGTTPGGPTYVTGSNSTGDLLSKRSVQSAMKEFLAEGANWNDLYERWEAKLTEKEVSLPITIWRGIASRCAKETRRQATGSKDGVHV
jgi:hypothetical protein